MDNFNDDDDIAEISPDQRYIRYSEILARGAYKIVYKGFDEVDGIEVTWNQVCIAEALKCPGSLEKLCSELDLLKSLKHANIIKSYASWVDHQNKTINLITELFTSGSLREYRNKHRTVDVKAIKNWARQILRGLNYLHSHTPPIIHRDLKCDNIFINGNHGNVKIGTPELMSPELIDNEEYNELVDIYSFGMCMLELATCQTLCCECKTAAQIFEEATSGVKPAALSKVKDPLIKQFIERCLVPASVRLSAAELLNDPFLSDATPRVNNLPNSGHISMELDPKPQNISHGNVTGSMKSTSQLSRLEIQRHNIRLSGEQKDSDSIIIIIRIPDLRGKVETIEFTYDIHKDTASSIAVELAVDVAEEFHLPKNDIAIISEMISDLLLKLVPSCKPSLPTSSALNQESSGISTEALDATGANNFGECSEEIIRYDSACSDSDISSDMSSLSLMEEVDECDDLMKPVLASTEVQRQGCCRDLVKKRQREVIQDLKRRLMAKHKLSPVSCI